MLSLASYTLIDWLEICENPTSHHVFFNDLFTSPDLVSELKSACYRATGTFRENHTNGCNMKSIGIMKKKREVHMTIDQVEAFSSISLQ